MSNKFDWSEELVVDLLMAKMTSRSTAMMLIEEFKNDKRYKPVLFTTEDGVEIEQGYSGNLWRVFITPCSFESWKPYKLGMPQYINTGEEKYFVSELKAIEYCFMNNPCLSIADVYNLCITLQFHNRVHDRADEDYYAVYVDLLYKRLKELAKTKLK